MTYPTIKMKISPRPIIKGKMDVRFPANVAVLSPIVLDRSNGVYTFSFDADALSANYASAAQGAKADSALQSVVAGTNVSVDNTDPRNPIVSAIGSGSGDVTGPSSSVDGEIALFNSTTGKVIKRASTTGILKASAGVVSAATAGTDYYNPGGTDVAIADGGTGQSTAAAAFDALAPTTTRGDLIFRNASTNTRLAASTAGYHLQTNGASTDPTYVGFVQAGTGAATRTWSEKAREQFSVEDFGAVGDGTTDDTVAIQAAIDAAGERSLLLFGAKTYKITSTLNQTYSYQEWRGAGKGATFLSFEPTADDTAIAVGDGANSVWYTKFSGFQLYSPDTTFTKKGITLGDVRGFVAENFFINGADAGVGGSDSWGGGTGSIGIEIKGREFIQIHESVTVVAEKPIVIGENPNSFIDFDHCRIDGALVADGYPVITVDGTNIYMSNSTFSGSWAGGTYGFYFDCATATATSHNLKFHNVRLEQGQSGTAYNFYIDGGTNSLQNLSFDNIYLDPSRNGFRLRGVLNAIISNTLYGSTTKVAVDADTTSNLTLINCYWQTGATASLVGVDPIRKGPLVPAGAPLPMDAYYSNRTPEIKWPTNTGIFAVSATPPIALDATTGDLTLTTVPVAQGGTGLTSGTSGGILYYSSTSAIASSALLAPGAIVVGGGAGTAPVTRSGATVDASNNINTTGDFTWTGAAPASWTPTFTSTGGTLTTVTITSAVSKKFGKLRVFDLAFTITAAGTGTGGVVVTMPSTIAYPGSTFAGRDGTTGKMLQGYVYTATTIQIRNYDNTSAIATGSTLQISGFYFE